MKEKEEKQLSRKEKREEKKGTRQTGKATRTCSTSNNLPKPSIIPTNNKEHPLKLSSFFKPITTSKQDDVEK